MRFVRISGKLHPSSERGVIRSSTLVANHCCRTGGRVFCRKVGVRLCTMRVRRHRSVRIDLNSSSLPPGFLDYRAIDLVEFNDVIVVDSTIRNQSTGIATLPECPSMWTSGFVCVGGGSTRGSAAGGGYGPGTHPAPRAVSRRLRAGPRRVCGWWARPGRSRRSGAGRL